MDITKINERFLQVQKKACLSPEHAAVLEMARNTGHDVTITITAAPGEFSDKPTEDGKFDAIYKVGITLVNDVEIV